MASCQSSEFLVFPMCHVDVAARHARARAACVFACLMAAFVASCKASADEESAATEEAAVSTGPKEEAAAAEEVAEPSGPEEEAAVAEESGGTAEDLALSCNYS